MRDPISVTILTKNSEKYLREVLESLLLFDQVLLFDTGSVDQTLDIAAEFSHTTIVHGSFNGFGPAHNLASSLAKHDWILSIDSDEILTRELAEEIASLSLEKGWVYSFPRRNEYRGKWIRGCGWHPDRQVRLYNRKETSFTDAHVHEAIQTAGLKEKPLQGAIRHYSYGEVSDFLQKMQHYSRLFAEQHQGKKKASLSTAILHAFFAFFKAYCLKGGVWMGREGFEISFYNANTAFYKYLKLAEANEHLKDQ